MRRGVTVAGGVSLAAIVFALLIGCPNPMPPDSDDLDSTVSISVGPDGGSFEIDAEMTVIVPPGAVDAPTQLGLSRVDAARWRSVFGEYEEGQLTGLAAFSLTPDTVVFHKPLTVEFTSVQAESASVPLMHAVDLGARDHVIAEARSEFDQTAGRLSVMISHGGAYVVEANRAWADRSAPLGAQRTMSAQSTEEDCRAGLIVVESSDSTVACSVGNCQITESTVRVQFMSCGGQPEESATFRESSPGCEPKVTVSPAAATMRTESTIAVEATVELGCAGCEGETVTFSAQGAGTVSPPSATTDPSGVASTTLSSGEEEGTVMVGAAATLRYPVREIIIDGQVIESFHRTEDADGSATVTVEDSDLEVWTGTITAELDYVDHIGITDYVLTIEVSFEAFGDGPYWEVEWNHGRIVSQTVPQVVSTERTKLDNLVMNPSPSVVEVWHLQKEDEKALAIIVDTTQLLSLDVSVEHYGSWEFVGTWVFNGVFSMHYEEDDPIHCYVPFDGSTVHYTAPCLIRNQPFWRHSATCTYEFHRQ